MIRHIEFTIDYSEDMTCSGEKEDFEIDTEDSIKNSLYDYLYDMRTELIHYAVIKKIWYEEDE